MISHMKLNYIKPTIIAAYLITNCNQNAAKLCRVCSHQLTKESSLLQQIPALVIGVERSLIYLE